MAGLYGQNQEFLGSDENRVTTQGHNRKAKIGMPSAEAETRVVIRSGIQCRENRRTLCPMMKYTPIARITVKAIRQFGILLPFGEMRFRITIFNTELRPII